MGWGDGLVSKVLVMRWYRLKFWLPESVGDSVHTQEPGTGARVYKLHIEIGGFLDRQATLSKSVIIRFSERPCLKK